MAIDLPPNGTRGRRFPRGRLFRALFALNTAIFRLLRGRGMRPLAAEVFGTFCLVFAGTGAVVVNDAHGGVVTAYATWNFGGRPGAKGLT